MAGRGAALAVVEDPHLNEEFEGVTLGEVQEFAEMLPERFLYCREMGHNWRPYSAGHYKDGGGFERTLRCTRCRTRRVQVITDRGVVLKNRYEYPDGYSAPTGMGQAARAGEGRGLLRLESIRRIVAKQE